METHKISKIFCIYLRHTIGKMVLFGAFDYVCCIYSFQYICENKNIILMSRQHHHEHSHHSHNISGKNLAIAVFLNILITIGQIIGGLFSGSMALLTDALHNFSDVIALLLSYFTNRLAKKESTIKQTYGYKRAEILAAFINSLTLIAIALFLLVGAVKKLNNPQEVLSDIVIYFALGSIILNALSVMLLRKDAKDSINMRSAYLHLLSDVMTSIVVMIGGVLMKYYGIYWLDSILSILIALYLIYSSYHILRESLIILMQFTPSKIDIVSLGKQISSIPEIKNIHHVHLWQLNDKELFFEAHIDLKEDIQMSMFKHILKEVSVILRKNNIEHFNIQPEYNVEDYKGFIHQH